MKQSILRVFDFISYLEAFKKLERFTGQYFWRDYPVSRYESDADHSWRMAMMLVALEPHITKPFDFKKAITMALIHDIPELIAGDPSPLGTDGTGNDSHAHNQSVANKKYEMEKRAAQSIFSKLPQDQADALYEIWQEFEACSTFEARLVKAIDKLEGKLQAVEYTNGEMFKEHFDFTMKYGVDTYAADPATQLFGDILLEKLKTSFKEFAGTPTRT